MRGRGGESKETGGRKEEEEKYYIGAADQF